MVDFQQSDLGTPNITPDPRQQEMLRAQKGKSVRHVVARHKRKFDVKTLPEDAQRVYRALEKSNGEEYALTFVFIMRTAVELHRAWHMTLLTSKILQQVKDKFGMAMTWDLGVFRLKFRVNDGAYELHRKVPYDYDSEFQDIYMRIAVALCEEHITIHEALLYQTETKQGKHTASSGLFLRDFPGRLILYPLLAMSCTVIFFGGDWKDGGVAAITGLVSGIIEYILAVGVGGEAKVLIDVFVGTSTGIIGALFYRYDDERYCLSAIFLGTLYWFFYGTAFVIGLLEIIAGELETGVTRFIAVSVKTFVLCLGAGFGMLMTLESASDAWMNQNDHCSTIDLSEKAWRIPLYLLSSAAALGQYRFPIVGYWRGLAVQLVGYEVQYQVQQYLEKNSALDNLDAAASNVAGAAAAVCAACLLSWIVDQLRYYYYGRILQRDSENVGTATGRAAYGVVSSLNKFSNAVGLGRKEDLNHQELGKKIRTQSSELYNPSHPRQALELTPNEDKMLVDIMIDAQDHNIWAVLMPAVYQLVPGSIIARMWFNALFPPPLIEEEQTIVGTNYTYIAYALDQAQENVFSNLMVISTSLALGLIIGFAVVQLFETIFCGCGICEDSATDIYGSNTGDVRKRQKRDLRGGMYTADNDDPDEKDPSTDGASSEAADGGAATSGEAGDGTSPDAGQGGNGNGNAGAEEVKDDAVEEVVAI